VSVVFLQRDSEVLILLIGGKVGVSNVIMENELM